MLAPMSSFANSLQNIASYFSVPSIGGLYYKDKSFSAIKASNDYATLVKKLLDVFQIGIPIYPDKYEENGGNEIGEQVLVGGVEGVEPSEGEQNSQPTAVGALYKIMDNVVVNPRKWTIHGYIGINIENSTPLAIASGMGLPNPFFNSFIRTFGRETLNSVLKRAIQYISEARRPFKFTTVNGETLPALINRYSVKAVPENQNWVEIDLEIQEFRFLALLGSNRQETVGGVGGIYSSPQDALRQLGRSTLKSIAIKVAS